MATSQGRQQSKLHSTREATYKATYNRRDAYVDGNTVRKLQAVPEPARKHATRQSNTVRKNQERAVHMNLGYVLFLTAALFSVAIVLVSYIQLQSDITNKIKNISKLESEYNDLKLANDEEYNRITSGIDLEQIKRVAIGELGMTYAEGDQIIEVEGQKDDYVRQLADIPN